MTRRTRALAISERVKEAVWERDGGRCIVCGSRYAAPNAHYISRAQGGLGIEQNIVTLCAECHRQYDQGTNRKAYARIILGYLQSHYPQMREKDLIYRKEDLI